MNHKPITRQTYPWLLDRADNSEQGRTGARGPHNTMYLPGHFPPNSGNSSVRLPSTVLDSLGSQNITKWKAREIPGRQCSVWEGGGPMARLATGVMGFAHKMRPSRCALSPGSHLAEQVRVFSRQTLFPAKVAILIRLCRPSSSVLKGLQRPTTTQIGVETVK